MGEINCAIEPAGDSNKPIPMHIMTNKYQINGSLSLSKLSDMVKEINENHVKEEEILSDCAYYYDHKEKSFYM